MKSENQQEKITKQDHAKYIESVQWKERKQKLFKDYNLGARCEVCCKELTEHRGPSQRQVHHNNYYRKNNGVMERDEDLIVLCYACHDLFHTKSRASSQPVSSYDIQCSTCGTFLYPKLPQNRSSRRFASRLKYRDIRLCYKCEDIFSSKPEKTYKKPHPKEEPPPRKKPSGKIIRRRKGLVMERKEND